MSGRSITFKKKLPTIMANNSRFSRHSLVAGAQTKKRVVELNAPVINEKEIKVECVHTYPHMALRSKVKETAEFWIAPDRLLNHGSFGGTASRVATTR
jgi:hypothetical protein